MKLSDAVAKVKMAMMDTAQKASIRRLNVLQETTPCKAGCASCCSRLVHISIAEALVIHEHLVRAKKWPEVKEQAKAMVELASTTHPLTWFKMNLPCPVLDPQTRLCRAYEVRPSPCSTHFVTSSPDVCDPWSTSSDKYENASFNDLHEEFMETLGRELSGRGVLELRLPMPAALLFAEKVQIQKNLTSDEIIALIGSELA